MRFQPSTITLGTAQLGMPYGISNKRGKPGDQEAFAILDRAISLGISSIDTARSYGTAEETIGKWLVDRRPAGVDVITKIPKVPGGSSIERKSFVRAQIAASKHTLMLERLPLVLAHEGSDLLDPAVVEGFDAAMTDGIIDGFGASVYDPDIATRLIATTPIVAMQAPASLADRRFEQAGVFVAAAERGIAVFARSIFLQGVLLMTPAQLPDHLKAFAPFLCRLDDAARRSKRSIPSLLVAALRDLAGVTSLVLGAETASQIDAGVEALADPPVPPAISEELWEFASRIPPAILLPTNWRHLIRNS